jgi:hypothetical protein
MLLTAYHQGHLDCLNLKDYLDGRAYEQYHEENKKSAHAFWALNTGDYLTNKLRPLSSPLSALGRLE